LKFFRIRELEREKDKIQKKFEKCKEKLKKEHKQAAKHQKDHTCIFRIKNNKHINYFKKSAVNQRRCRKQVRDLLKDVDSHLNGIGKFFVLLSY
jgi:hypothetical protein